MKFLQVMAVILLANFLYGCETTTGPVMNPNPPLATGGQDAALFAAKTY